jgi:SAM-dependent methyltransferase
MKEAVKRLPGVRGLRRWRANKWRVSRIAGDLARPPGDAEFNDTVDVEGWALALDGRDVVVDVAVGGGPTVTVQPNVPSTYLAELFGDVRGSGQAGFVARIPAADLGIPEGRAVDVTVTARTLGARGSSRVVLGRRRLTYRPGLTPHTRGDYGAEWDAVSQSLAGARISVCGSTDEQLHEQSGVATAGELVRVCGITRDHVVLEIGCGTGRVGSKLAPQCREWIGCDVSRAMLEHTRKAMGTQANFRLVHLNGRELNGVADASIDVVYSTGVFMHLDEWDRYRYVCEAFRVLHPGGRVYVDSMNLLGEEGWAQFLELARLDPLQRPTRIGKTSTPQELEHYVTRAGFSDVQLASGPLWVTCWGRKPAAGG